MPLQTCFLWLFAVRFVVVVVAVDLLLLSMSEAVACFVLIVKLNSENHYPQLPSLLKGWFVNREVFLTFGHTVR
jgi:hypothetical protein